MRHSPRQTILRKRSETVAGTTRPGGLRSAPIAVAGSTAVVAYEGDAAPPPYEHLRVRDALQSLFPTGCGYAGELRMKWQPSQRSWRVCRAVRLREHHPPEDVTALLTRFLRERGLPMAEP